MSGHCYLHLMVSKFFILFLFIFWHDELMSVYAESLLGSRTVPSREEFVVKLGMHDQLMLVNAEFRTTFILVQSAITEAEICD